MICARVILMILMRIPRQGFRRRWTLLVAGLVALLFSAGAAQCTPEQIEAFLNAFCTDHSTDSWCVENGYPTTSSAPSSTSTTTTTPPGSVKPDASNTGPRFTLTRTLTADQALAELRATGRISRALVHGPIVLRPGDGRDWVIEDSRIEANGAAYVLRAFADFGAFTGPGAFPIFRYVEFVGGAATGQSRCSSALYVSHVVIEHSDVYGCEDGVKTTGNTTLRRSWFHDNDHPDGAHCDGIQIRSGTGILIEDNRFDAYIGYSSDGSALGARGDTCSGGLQTGSVIGTINARFTHNWWAGGHYTFRGWADRDLGYSITYVSRDNIWMRQGTSVAIGRTDLPPNRYGPVTGYLGDFDSSNRWEDGAPL